MTVTRDQLLGSGNNATGVTINITTAAAAAANSIVVVTFSYFDTAATAPTCTVGGVSATLDKQVNNGNDRTATFSRVVAAGLAISSTIACNIPVGGGGFLAGACSYLGTNGLDTTTSATTTGTSFSSGAATNAVADALYVAVIGSEAVATTVGGTNTNGTSRVDQYNSGAGQGMRMLDLIATTSGSQALTGTWASTSTATTGSLVIYSGTAGAATGSVFVPQRMPLGA